MLEHTKKLLAIAYRTVPQIARKDLIKNRYRFFN
jgi:hypothetical protein